MLNVGDLKKLLENIPDDTKVTVQVQPEATIAKEVTGIWGPTTQKPSLTIVAVTRKTSQKLQAL